MGRCCIALLLVVLGCGEGTSRLFVHVRTDYAPGVELFGVRTELSRPGQTDNVSLRELDVGEAIDGLGGFEVAAFDGLGRGQYDLRVRLLGAQDAVLAERLSAVRLGRDTIITLRITRDCEDVSCPRPADAPTLTACAGGQCVDPTCSEERPEACGEPECQVDGDCPAGAACAEARCIAGFCFADSNLGRCPDGQWCHPETGCQLRSVVSDAGRSDAGVIDAAGVPDGSAADAGCSPEDDPTLCASEGIACGPLSTVDRCGGARSLDCGSCGSAAWCDFGTCTACGSTTCTLSSESTFEGLPSGQSADGLAGWRVTGTYDEEITTDDTGNTVWRVSNAITSDAFAEQPFSPCPAGRPASPPSETSMAVPEAFAGESVTGARYRRFVAELRFRSATGGPQPGLSVTISADAGGGARQTYVDLEDTGSGLRVRYQGYVSGNFSGGTAVSGLDYTSYHTLRIEVTFADGTSNDTVRYFVDGAMVASTRSWEQYYRQWEPANGVVPVQCLLFRIADGAVPATMGAGFFIDDVRTVLHAE